MTTESPFEGNGSLRAGATVADVTAYMAAAPEWRFATNPVNAVSRATTTAAQADLTYRRDSAAFWTHTAVLLVALANNPYIQRGTILDALIAKYGEPA